MKLSILLLMALVSIAPGDTVAASNRNQEACDRVKQKIRAIESRMRAGYTASQGVRLEEKLRKLKDERHRVCR